MTGADLLTITGIALTAGLLVAGVAVLAWAIVVLVSALTGAVTATISSHKRARRLLAQADADAEQWASVREMLDRCPFCHGTELDSRTCNCPEEGCRRPWCPRYDTTAGCAPGRDCGPGCECR